MIRHVPYVYYNILSYEIKCPKCKKPIQLDELENESYCSVCGIFWNRYAKGLLDFYYLYSKRLYTETIKELNKEV